MSSHRDIADILELQRLTLRDLRELREELSKPTEKTYTKAELDKVQSEAWSAGYTTGFSIGATSEVNKRSRA